MSEGEANDRVAALAAQAAGAGQVGRTLHITHYIVVPSTPARKFELHVYRGERRQRGQE